MICYITGSRELEDNFHERFLKYRHIQTPCTKCKGVGKFRYPDTGTYKTVSGMIVGRAFTLDVCDACWGSGDSDNKGEDLNKLSENIRDLKDQLEEMFLHQKHHKLTNGHWCPDWDYLFVCDKCPEKEGCTCKMEA